VAEPQDQGRVSVCLVFGGKGEGRCVPDTVHEGVKWPKENGEDRGFSARMVEEKYREASKEGQRRKIWQQYEHEVITRGKARRGK